MADKEIEKTPPEEADEVTSDQLLSAFTRGGFLKWVAVAVVAHVVFIAVFSIGSLVKRFAPEKPAAEEEEAPSQAAQPAPAAQEEAAQPAAAATSSASAAASQDGEETDEEIMRSRSNSPVIQRITEAANPDEIPSEPGDLGISLEDTQVR